ncbi:PEP-utilizing protein mobile subunit [Amycolatopsis acidiphila]|uniref:PEP-utilizing protein mobile subunit n=1 Tax=Amycolatopsis acidiphila TaxID=715473 RepID=A0A558ABR2_9PSEU|nr:PEP-utilizing enzyme [Amycolatopsis acidiphila]TVT21700.1 PEP-utilizing protein mobile subunit [Amycolatopsis acidiphila]UIJ59761.1 PEP-utilizing protein mobile subunit [Amycolatopsis acidiphila]GHG98458.1 hypothetical protein GCM10017788_78570 [Amycolatopsis acidiphila]
MVTIVPVDQFIADGGYPGYTPLGDRADWLVKPSGPFREADEQRFWFLDFHWPQGLTPMGLACVEDVYSWGTQLAAEALPVPIGRGIAHRIAGTHIYAAAIEVTHEAQVAERTRRLRASLPAFVNNFDAIWAARVGEIGAWWDRLWSVDVSSLSRPELGEYLREARRFHRRAFEIHFEVMYPLLINYLGFHRACTGMGIAPGEVAKFLQGYDTKIMETDRTLYTLARKARQAGLREVFVAHAAHDLRGALSRRGGRAASWLTEFDDFLRLYGDRAEGTSDIALPSWAEDPTPPLKMIKSFLRDDADHDFAAARNAAVEEREAAIDAARAGLTSPEQEIFDAGLASCQVANFPWWQDEHNLWIDLRASLPLRWACLRVSDAVGAGRPDDALFLFWPELMAVVDGTTPYDTLRQLVEDRRQYFDHWQQRRPDMPKILGTVPDAVTDPILIEVFGLDRHFLQAVSAGDGHTEVRSLTGMPAAGGVARGIARVLFDAAGLHRVQRGDVLVCESTSPNWTPAFGKVAACVCDGGGSLSHAAIVGREYRIPTVTAVGVATTVIQDGDEIEVDGTRGVVTVLRRAARIESLGAVS